MRGAFGMYDVLPLPYQFSLMISKQGPFYKHGTARPLDPGSFYKGIPAKFGSSSFVANYIEPNPHRNYAMQWNLDVQRSLTKDVTALLAYVGSRGVHQGVQTDDVDTVVPIKTQYGYLFPSPVGTGTVINQYFGQI